MFNFTEKVVLVVGGAGYLCTPVCEGFASRGAHVVVTDLSEEKAATLAQSLEDKHNITASGVAFDIADEAAIKPLIDGVMEKFGRLDVIINAVAKGTHSKHLEEITAADFTSTARIQLSNSFLLAKEAGKVMQPGGNMVFFSSMYGRVPPDPGCYQEPMQVNPIDYGVVKGGLDQMIRYLAVYYAQRNIRVNGVAPGAFPHAAAVGSDKPDYEGFIERLAQKAPMKRIGRQNELAGPVIFLASDEASFVTGQILVVDGGWTIW